MHKQVVVTGLGVVSPLGNDKDSFWQAICEGKSGADKITRFDASGFSSQIACEVKGFEPDRFIEKKDLKKMSLFIQYALVAAMEAIQDSELKIEKENPDKIGVMVGSGVGGLETIEEQLRVLFEKGADRISPFFIPKILPNMASSQVSIYLGVKSCNLSISTACAAGTHSIGVALDMIRLGYADVMIAGGTEAAIISLAHGGFCSMKALSSRNDEPQKASRPFDRERDGFVMAEGAGIVVLESLEHALNRNANIYAELAGFGMSADAYHITAPAPDGKGAVMAMKNALKNAGLPKENIDYINAHGTSTPLNDKYETMAIKEVFGQHAGKLAVSSTKSMTGHMLGAAGAAEFIVCALTIRDGIIPPTINYEYPDPECDLDYVPNVKRHRKVDGALSNSFGFGGQNACLIVKNYEAAKNMRER